MDLDGKVALVTGAAQGIGFATVQKLLQRGVKNVSICDIASDRGKEAVAAVNKEFGAGRAVFIKTDVTKQQDLEEAFKKTIASFGKIDIVVNNAGIINDAIWEKELDINVLGVVRGTRLGLQYMNGTGGAIVNIASVAGLGLKSASPVYDGSKYFVVGYSRAIASPPMDQSHGVRVLIMCPGLTDTPVAEGVLRGYEDNNVSRQLVLEKCLMQEPDNVAEGIIHILKEGASGSVWVSDGCKPVYEVQIPDLVK